MDPTISPSCATWLSMSCERTTPSLPCVESSSSQAGMTNTWPSLSLNFEMRLPCVAFSVAAKIVVIVEDEDAGVWSGSSAIEPGGREAADTTTNDDKIVVFLGRNPVDRKRRAFAQRMRGLERPRMMAAHSGEGRRIERRLCRELRGRRQPGRNRQCDAVEEITTADSIRHVHVLRRVAG